jgi:hypothetical protein
MPPKLQSGIADDRDACAVPGGFRASASAAAGPHAFVQSVPGGATCATPPWTHRASGTTSGECGVILDPDAAEIAAGRGGENDVFASRSAAGNPRQRVLSLMMRAGPVWYNGCAAELARGECRNIPRLVAMN